MMQRLGPTLSSQSALTSKLPILNEPARIKTTTKKARSLTRLQIAMEHICRVNILEPSQNLVHEVLKVSLSQWLLRANDLMQVCLHEFLNDVDLVEVVWIVDFHVMNACDLMALQ